MPLTIGHEETERLALELARETGEPVDRVIHDALAERLRQLRGRRTEAEDLARIREAVRRCSALPDRETTPADAIRGYADIPRSV